MSERWGHERTLSSVTLRRLLLVVAAAALAQPAAALAGTATLKDGTLTYVGAAGEANSVLILMVGSTVAVRESDIVAGEGCTKTVSYEAYCPGAVTGVIADAGDMDDHVRVWLTANASITGGSGNDELEAGRGSDTVNGGPGDDSIVAAACAGTSPCPGRDGTDVLIGGDGTDAVTYFLRSGGVTVSLDGEANDGEPSEFDNVSSDVEKLTGGSGPDLLTGNDVANVIDGEGGDDVVSGGGGADVLSGGNGGADEVHGGDGDDSLSGGLAGGADVLSGENGDDFLARAWGGIPYPADLSGGAGADTVSYSSSFGAVNVTLDGVANDGESGVNDNVRADVEHLIGSRGDDTLVGNAAANVLDGREGADLLVGGDGSDTVDYSARLGPVTVTLDGTADDGERPAPYPSGGPRENDNVAADIEIVRGGSGHDTLVGSGADNVLDGGGGDDLLDGRGGADGLTGGDGADTVDYSSRLAAVTVSLDGVPGDGESGENDSIAGDVESAAGGAGDDTITGSTGPNVLRGGGGDDLLAGGPGDDILDGGVGDDQITGGSGTDEVTYSDRTLGVLVTLDGIADDGEDNEFDDIAPDVEDVTGGAGNDVLVGGNGPNVLTGGGGDDLLDGLLGADVLDGGPGLDLADYSARTASVVVDLDGVADDGESAENDTLLVEDVAGGSGDDSLTGDGGENVLSGGGGNDSIAGLAGDDLLVGNAGSDTLAGGDGDDALVGGAGADTFTGGAGDDFVDYSGRVAPLRIDLDGAVGDDGEFGEGDTLGADVEVVEGGSGSDVIAGNAAENLLIGGGGADTIDGLGGIDLVVGDDGTDTITSRDAAADAVVCGADADSVTADTLDYVETDCESVDRGTAPPPPSGGGGGGGGGGPDAVVTIAVSNARPAPGEVVELRVTVANKELIVGATGLRLVITLPAGLTLLGPPATDRGSGCVGTTTLDCFLDYLPGAASTLVRFSVNVGAAGTKVVGARATMNVWDPDETNNAASIALQVIAPAQPPPPPPPPRGVTRYGSARADVLRGTAYADTLSGLGGDDRLEGLGGGDRLLGGRGRDIVLGGSGNDRIEGSDGNDRLFGGGGADSLDGGLSRDLLEGGAGADVVRSVDRAVDVVRCGPGRDRVVADRADRVGRDCELVTRR